MAAVRFTTAPLSAPDRPKRQRVLPGEVPPVIGGDGVDAERRRSLKEELTAAEERIPTVAPEAAAAEVREVVEELNRLGAEAVNVLQPLNEKAVRLAEHDHVDEQA